MNGLAAIANVLPVCAAIPAPLGYAPHSRRAGLTYNLVVDGHKPHLCGNSQPASKRRRAREVAGFWHRTSPGGTQMFGWSLAVACLLGAFVLGTSLLLPLEGGKSPLLTFVLATLIVARYGGFWPGIATSLVGLVVADYCSVELRWAFLPLAKLHWTSLLSYFGITMTAIALLNALQRANLRAEQDGGGGARGGKRHVEAERRVGGAWYGSGRWRSRKRIANWSLSAIRFRTICARRYAASPALACWHWRIIATNSMPGVWNTWSGRRRPAGGWGWPIQDLMNLSIVNRAELRRQELPGSQLATETRWSGFANTSPSVAAEVIIAPGLKAGGDPGLLRIVLENLLGNAWKFTARTPEPKIEVGSTGFIGPEMFFVRDNGAGFDMAHADRLFGAFQRLHSEADFPGTGIGLATVRRIIARHGGQVWAQGKVNEGATICFTLPECAGG